MSVSQQEMRDAWKSFVVARKSESYRIRHEILHSWHRCLNSGVDPFQRINRCVLKASDIEERRKRSWELIEISLPVMHSLYQFVAGSGFIVALADGDGIILEIIGDPEAVELTGRANFIVGANWSEDVIGTNAVGTALSLDRPIQVYGYEHWCICVQNGTCSAAPIHDPESGKIIGVLDMTGSFEKVNPHTLGMVVAAVTSIENQMATNRAWNKYLITQKYKSLIMESMSEGVLAADKLGNITHFNRKASEILHIGQKEAVGLKITELFGKGAPCFCQTLLDILQSGRQVTDEMIVIDTVNGVVRCTVTSRRLNPGNDENCIGTIVIFHEISRINRLINRIMAGSAKATFDDLIGQERKFLDTVAVAVRAAQSTSNILLMGESGTGKDIFAQAIHNTGPRRSQPFVAINCSAIPRDLLGSELFGYEEGAFTGAKRGGNPGKFELADHGTIFLDEIGDMPLDMQTALLRVLEERAVTRIGGKTVILVDVRVIAATNRDLVQAIADGAFRGDLFYRLNVISIEMVPLRERKEDIPLLVEHLVKKIASRLGKQITAVDPDVLNAFLAYQWPGNVRELQNIIERAINLARGNVLTSEIFADHLCVKQPLVSNKPQMLKELEDAVIINCIKECDGNRSLVAKKLGIARSTLYRKLELMKKMGYNF